MNYKTKAGVEFELKVNKIVISFKFKKTNPPKDKPSHDWKVLSVVAVFLLLFSSGAYAALSGHTLVLEKFLDAVVKGVEVYRKG